jgi:lipopolysaccharide transport system permease protein
MLAPLIVLITLLSIAVGLWMSALNVRYRDVRYGLPFLVQLWMFASPIIYPLSMIPEKWRWVLALNPLTGIIEGFRAALSAHTHFNWWTLAFSAAITLLLLVYSGFAFRKVEKTFADIV